MVIVTVFAVLAVISKTTEDSLNMFIAKMISNTKSNYSTWV